MKRQQIAQMQRRIRMSYAPENRHDSDDGFWGPLSIAACKKHLLALMPKPNPWPTADDASMRRFYGNPADPVNMSMISVIGMGIKFSNKSVSNIYCHNKIGPSLRRILAEISTTEHAWVLKEYAGCFFNRNMRSSSRISKHAWGVAIDLAPRTNGLWTVWPNRSNMPLEVMELFAREGWINLGWTIGRDGMHSQATR